MIGTMRKHRGFDLDFLLLLSSAVGAAFLLAASRTQPQGTYTVWIALLPLLLAIRLFSTSEAVLSGLVWGLSVLVFSRGVPGTGFEARQLEHTAAILVLAPAVFTYFGCLLTRRIGFNPTALALIWIVLDLGLASTGIHGGISASTMPWHDAVARAVAGVLGYSSIGFFLIFLGALSLHLIAGISLRRPRWRWGLETPQVFLPRVGQPLSRCRIISPLLHYPGPRAPPVALLLL
jgi:hypothetical protein